MLVMSLFTTIMFVQSGVGCYEYLDRGFRTNFCDDKFYKKEVVSTLSAKFNRFFTPTSLFDNSFKHNFCRIRRVYCYGLLY